MIAIYYRSGERIIRETDLRNLPQIDPLSVVWVDLNQLNDVEKRYITNKFGINLYEKQQQEEIESSSRYQETNKMIVANSNFLIQSGENYQNDPATFILKNNYLITHRTNEFRSFIEVSRKVMIQPKAFPTGYHVLISIFEHRIDLDADILEMIAREISRIGRELGSSGQAKGEVLIRITRYQELTMMLRQNLLEKQRMVAAMLRSEHFPKDCYDRLRIMVKDVNSLMDHTSFSFDRLEYLQDTFLGLINLEQNKIIKMFSVAAVVFLPPTLVASIYGMNFEYMPELSWRYGYVFSLVLMVLSIVASLWFFKRRGWL
ncbi:MAG: magnesium/cobalt transporter CorA [Chitinophagales bacterium]|nr:magnesium/cobalt transporter CorA [Chitinophagales bacterium]MDW8427131.1 magnesium/cobalt transporter CorA [Chitinophagales bacterium]